MSSLILVLFGLAILASLVTVLVFTIRRFREDARQPSRPRTAEERARDSRSALIWVAVAVLLVGGLSLAYLLTQSA
ncbi:hypothetical protein [Brachybacterium squillarum]|uniref:hypothetical protein n=1 Tax=Brachybacterium squillarum TaxID=661979 RepID=UPI0002629B70|nr:hypothetical protein [Brachybacterium squillarum]